MTNKGVPMKYSHEEYVRLLNLSLDEKIAWSEQVILKALKSSKNPCVSCSWGKDSVVMLHLVRKFCKNTFVLFANTQCEYPETYKYRDYMLKHEFADCNYIETKPIKTFWQCVEEYGFPENRGKGKFHTPKCCVFLKEKPLILKEKELGIDVSFMGIQASESRNRKFLFMRMGELYFNKTKKIFHCLPLAIWTDSDVFEYAKRNKLKMSGIYKKMSRNGCMFCTGYKGWQNVMGKYNPQLYSTILNKKDGQQTFKECNL